MWSGFNSRSALIVVDVQNDFAHPLGSLHVRGAEEIIEPLCRLIRGAERAGSVVVYTQDWHPRSTPHFKTSGGPWPVHCVADSWGAQLVAGLPRASPSIHIHKGTGLEDGYSAFTVIDTAGHHRPTGLGSMLRRLGVEQVLVAGLATDYCVRHTALDARHEGFEAAVALEAVRGVNLSPGDVMRAIEELSAAEVELLTPAAGRAERASEAR